MPGDPQEAVETEQLDTNGDQGELLGNYQLCHVDTSTEYGKKVAEAFRAKEFPFTAIIDKTGSIVLTKKEGQLSQRRMGKHVSQVSIGRAIERVVVYFVLSRRLR